MKLFKACLLSGALLLAVPAFSQTLKDAIRLTDNEQFQKAAAAYQKLIQAQPSNGEIYFYYGENYFRNEEADSAAMMYQKGIDVNATHPLNYVGLGKIALVKGKDAEAKSHFYKASTALSGNKNATVLTKIAEAYLSVDPKNVEEAMKNLNLALKLEPANVETRLVLGDAHLENPSDPQSGGNAIKQYEKAIELDKTSAKGYLRAGKLWVRAKNWSLALEQFKKAIETEPNFAPAYRERAELYFRAGKYSEAVADYEKYLQLNNDPAARVRYAQFLYLAKQYSKSIEEINKIQAKDSSNVVLFRIMGYNLYETKDYPKGLSYMNRFFEKAKVKGTKIIPDDYIHLGRLQSGVGQDSLAVLSLQKGFEMDTTRKDIYSEIGVVQMKRKKYQEAAEAFEKKIAGGGDVTINDYNYLGKSYYILKDYVKADTAFAMVVKMYPALPLGHLWRAKSKVMLDPETKEGLAKPFYEQFILLAQSDVAKNKKDLIDAYEYLGFYYFQKKDYACAKVAFEKLKEIDPANAKAKTALADVNLVKATGTCELLPKPADQK
jgi:tetratricopeptide (TPR) repeat protein